MIHSHGQNTIFKVTSLIGVAAAKPQMQITDEGSRENHVAGAELRPGALPGDDGEAPRRAGPRRRAPPPAGRPGRLRRPTTGAGAPSWAGRRCWSARSTAAAPSADHGLVDLSLVAYEFGRHAAPGPLAVANVVAAALSETGRRRRTGSSRGLLSGSVARHLVPRASRSRTTGSGPSPCDIRVDGDEVVLNGVKRPGRVGRAWPTTCWSPGAPGTGLTQVLVPAGTAGRDGRPRWSRST